MPRRIQPVMTRRPQPRWVQILLTAGIVLGLLYFFLGDTIQAVIDRYRDAETENVRMVQITFGESDAPDQAGYASYYRYELVPISVRVRRADGQPLYVDAPRVRVFREGIHVRDAGGRARVPMRYDEDTGAWEGNWPMPLGSEPALYTLRCELRIPVDAYPDDYDWRARRAPTRRTEGRSKRLQLVSEDSENQAQANPEQVDQSMYRPADGTLVREVVDREFAIAAREPREIPRGLGVVTYETAMTNVLDLKTERPNGEEGDWTAIFDWLDLYAADALWYSAFITDTRYAPLPSGSVWFGPTRRAVDAMGYQAHSRGYLFGAYAYAYRMFGDESLLPPYNMVQANDHPDAYIPSILDRGRIRDLTAMVREMDANPNVDMIGFDYIRDGNVGFAAVDQFVDDIRPHVPADWGQMTSGERQEWLKGEIAAWSSETAQLWNWWRAHTVAMLLRDIIETSECEKPIWTFTLSWRHGEQHGQDPYMFTDAGVAMDAVMLYELDSQEHYRVMMEGIRKTKQEGSWSVYTRASALNLVFGNQVDFNSHQRVTDPPAPQRYYQRLVTAMEECDHFLPPAGVFCHDVMRGITGATGPYSGREWVLAGAAAMTRCREMNKKVPATASLVVPYSGAVPSGSSLRGTIKLSSLAERPIEILGVTTFDSPGISGKQDIYAEPAILQPGGTVEIPAQWYVSGPRPGGPAHGMLAARIHWGSPEHAPTSTVYTYVGVR